MKGNELAYYKEQIQSLKKRGLIINNEEKAINVLSNFNYYTFLEYFYQFKINNCSSQNYKCIEGTTFEQIYKIYLFDRKFRNIILYAIEIIEISLKTKLAYISAEKIGDLGYLQNVNFKSEKEFRILKAKINSLKNKNQKLNFAKYHNISYNNTLSISIIINIFSMGMIYNYYKNISENKNKNLKITKDNKMSIRKKLAKEYKTGEIQLESWIENISYIRNAAAHYMRLYNVKLQKTPVKCKKNHGENYIVSNRVFDIIHIMKFLILNNTEWNNILLNIDALFNEYEDILDISLLGFPKNWFNILKK